MAKQQTIWQAESDKKHSRQIHLKFNIQNDADVLAQLSKQRSMQGYIRDLIREDISRQEALENQKE